MGEKDQRWKLEAIEVVGAPATGDLMADIRTVSEVYKVVTNGLVAQGGHQAEAIVGALIRELVAVLGAFPLTASDEKFRLLLADVVESIAIEAPKERARRAELDGLRNRVKGEKDSLLGQLLELARAPERPVH